jgi:predicted nucleic acid-binding protein
VSAVVVDTSAWIDFFAGRESALLEAALAEARAVLAPIVAAELVSGARSKRDRDAICDMLADLPIVETPLEHWIRVGELRLLLRAKGVSVSTPDAHVAQCALDRQATLLTRDRVFERIAALTELRVAG